MSETGNQETIISDVTTWVIAQQDCDLVVAEESTNIASVEVRPVISVNPPKDWGIRSRFFRLMGDLHVEADAPRNHVSPRLLHELGAARRHEPGISDDRIRGFKTWLGLRYDRPAVPEELVPLAQEISRVATKNRTAEATDQIHDLLMQFDPSSRPYRYKLFAVITPTADRETVKAWLGTIGTEVSAELGTLAAYEIGTKAQTSLELIEDSYSANLSSITWRGESPVGAE